MSCDDCSKYRRLHHAARSLWMFRRGYVSDGKEIPEGATGTAEEEASRFYDMAEALRELERSTPHVFHAAFDDSQRCAVCGLSVMNAVHSGEKRSVYQ